MTELSLSLKLQTELQLYVDNFPHSSEINEFDYDHVKEQAFSMPKNRLFRSKAAKVLPVGLQSASLKIEHSKKSKYVFVEFQTTKEEGTTNSWEEYKSLELDISFKNQTVKVEKGAIGVKVTWDSIKQLSGTVANNETETELFLRSKLFDISGLKLQNYVYGRKKFQSPLFNFFLKAEVTIKFLGGEDSEISVQDYRKLNRAPSFMKTILMDGQFSDFTIIASGKTFPCHKNILAGQSQVFATMFSTNMTEAESEAVKIDDMTSEGVDAFLKYLYCRDLEDVIASGDIGFELLRAGHKYEIKDLELECRDSLLATDAKKFSAKTAFELFEFSGNVFGLENLMKKAAKVIDKNAKEYMDTGELATFLSENPTVGEKLILIMSQNY